MPRESGYYPPGAEFDPRAPWNQPELDPDPCECGNGRLLDEASCGECYAEEAGDVAMEARRDRERDEAAGY